MERRHSKRIIVNLKAELISGSVSYAGFIGNLSEDGIYLITDPTKTPVDFTPGTPLEVKFEPLTGETLCLNCMVKWSYKTPPHGLANSIGLEIIDTPLKYKEFLKTL